MGHPASTVLLTGGRAPATLALARLLHRAGQRVLVAESLRWPLCRFSRAVARAFRVPPPRFAPDPFADALEEIVRAERVDLLIPTCEETLYVARARERLRNRCVVFCSDFETVRRLHDKHAFNQRARALGLDAPPTARVSSPEEAARRIALGERIVLKPVYSRFGNRTVVLPRDPKAVEKLPIAPDRPWVAQAYVAGREVCSYSVAHGGRITAHAAYRPLVRLETGSAVAFERVDHPAARDWVRRFAEAERLTGQFGFDFVEDDAGVVWALECNPRLTSGVHLFAPGDGLGRALLDPNAPPAAPTTPAAYLWLPSRLQLLTNDRLFEKSALWPALRRHGRNVLRCADDPWPARLQWLPILVLLGRALRQRTDLISASTADIEWNGP